MTVVANLPRSERAFLRNLVILGSLPLFMVSPKQLPGYAGRSGYFFATRQGDGPLKVISKNCVPTRDVARSEAKIRFGHSAKEIRENKARKAA